MAKRLKLKTAWKFSLMPVRRGQSTTEDWWAWCMGLYRILLHIINGSRVILFFPVRSSRICSRKWRSWSLVWSGILHPAHLEFCTRFCSAAIPYSSSWTPRRDSIEDVALPLEFDYRWRSPLIDPGTFFAPSASTEIFDTSPRGWQWE